jgi:hypothetical protein
MENNETQLLPELKDIREMILRYNVTHPEGCFIFRFVGYKDVDEICPDCGEKCMCEIDERKSDIGAFGDIETVRAMLNELREVVEDNKTTDGFVVI